MTERMSGRSSSEKSAKDDSSGEPVPLARRDEEEALHAVEAACFVEASIVRLGRRLDELGERVAKVENRSGSVSREEQAARRHEGGAL